MGSFERESSAGTSGSSVSAQMPPVAVPSWTDQVVQRARRSRPADEHWTHTEFTEYVQLLRDRFDSPLYMGANDRPAILLCLSGPMRGGLDGLAARIRRKGADLFLQGHRLGPYGMVRAILDLPKRNMIYENPLTLANGDVQEFISAGYQNEEVELHLAHTNTGRSVGLACRATGIRPVVDALMDAVHGLAHPTTEAEMNAPAAEMEAKFPEISDGLSEQTRIRLSVTGSVDGFVKVEIRN